MQIQNVLKKQFSRNAAHPLSQGDLNFQIEESPALLIDTWSDGCWALFMETLGHTENCFPETTISKPAVLITFCPNCTVLKHLK